MTVQLWLGDCLELMKQIPEGSVDAVITDPPYGIPHVLPWQKAHGYDRFPAMQGNDEVFDPRPWLKFPTVVLWGANNFTEHLPKGGWLCWLKRVNAAADKIFGSPFELAWCNKATCFRLYRIAHGGYLNADGAGRKRIHPTQKPVLLMRHVLHDLTQEGDTILDPYMGSGTTGVACVQMQRNFIGMEINPQYFAAAKTRIEKMQEQLREQDA